MVEYKSPLNQFVIPVYVPQVVRRGNRVHPLSYGWVPSYFHTIWIHSMNCLPYFVALQGYSPGFQMLLDHNLTSIWVLLLDVCHSTLFSPLSQEMQANPISHRVYLFIYLYGTVLFVTACGGWVLGLTKAITKVQKAARQK